MVSANLRYEIDQLFRESSIEGGAIASVLSPTQIAESMGTDLATAKAIKEKAKCHVADLWAFEDASWER